MVGLHDNPTGSYENDNDNYHDNQNWSLNEIKKESLLPKGRNQAVILFLRHGRNGIAVSNSSITGPLKCHNNLQTDIVWSYTGLQI